MNPRDAGKPSSPPSTSKRSSAGAGLLLAALLLSGFAANAGHYSLEEAVRSQNARQQRIQVERFIETLRIEPWMNILDMGAGPGYVSFLFAEKIRGGSGKVFSTDIRTDFVDRITEESKKRELFNIVPALVKPEGLDGFYLRNKYDLVYLSNAYHCIDPAIPSFTRLRGQINRGGRLVVVIHDPQGTFTPSDVSDWAGLLSELRGLPKGDPFRDALSEGTWSLLQSPPRADAGELHAAVLADFNRALVDASRYRRFLVDSRFVLPFTDTELDFVVWLATGAREQGLLDSPLGPDHTDLRALIRLNRMFFTKRFGRFLVRDGRGSYIPLSQINRFTSKRAAVRELEAAGFRLSGEARLTDFFVALVFASD